MLHLFIKAYLTVFLLHMFYLSTPVIFLPIQNGFTLHLKQYLHCTYNCIKNYNVTRLIVGKYMISFCYELHDTWTVL